MRVPTSLYKRIFKVKSLHYLCRILTLLTTSVFVSTHSFAQYFPGPAPVSAKMEYPLKEQLKNRLPDAARVKVLIQLTNLCYNKPSQNPRNLNEGGSYAAEAIRLSKQLHDPQSYNTAELLKADILIDQDKMQDAAKILPLINDTTKVNLLLTLAFHYANRTTGRNNDNQDSAMYYVQMAKPLAAKLHQQINMITCLKYTGSIHAGLGNLSLGEQELLEALKEYKEARYPRLQYTYLELAQLYRIKGDFDKALLNNMQALHYMKLSGDTTYAGDFYLFMAIILSHDAQHQQSLNYSRLAFEHVKNFSGYADLPTAVYQVTCQLISLHQFPQALAFTLAQYKRYPPNNTAQKELYLGTIGDCYLKLKQFQNAERYFLAEYSLRKASDPFSETTYHRLAFYYIETKRYQQALPYLAAALKYIDPDATLSLKNHLHYMLYLADSAAGRYKSAMSNLMLTKKYDDTMYKANKVADIQKLLIQYDAQNKNEQIKQLKQKETLQDGYLRQANQIRNLTIGGLITFIIIGIIFYRQNLRKHRDSLLISQKNKQLERLLNEKEWLLKEVHHRVKNNLYTVFCLLEIQAEFLEDDALLAIENCQRRIYAMSLIHQKLYLADDVKTVNMADYLRELVNYLKDSFETKQPISYHIDIAPLHLDISQAMPLGLIINEAISNSIKYAFPREKRGTISISIEVNDKVAIVKLRDDGIGFSEQTRLSNPNSLGLKLMKGLADDIDAKISFGNKNGAQIMIVFTPTALTEKLQTGNKPGEREAAIED